jgi:CO dehydrogenase/acetyl-CoA synthase beta subunit
MELFEKYHNDITSFLSQKEKEGKVTELFHHGKTNWPSAKNRNLVLGHDAAVELGNPKDVSTSCLLWVNDPDKVNNKRITLIGPDLSDIKEKQIPFGKVVIVGVEGFNEDNCYNRYREMELLRYDIQLKGYMMRGVSQYQREWSRISREAVDNGFSFRIMGGALIDKLLELDYVRSVETIFITSSQADVIEMLSISDGVVKILGAMNKMAAEGMSLDCDSCEYTEVCSDVAEMRSMRKSFEKKEAANYG